VDIPHRLTAQLGGLSDALDEPGADLEAMLAVLADDLITAVPSFLGLTMTMAMDGEDVILHLFPPEGAGSVVTSLLLPLSALGHSGTGGDIVFYATQPGAFVDIAADARFAFNMDGQVILDEHLPSPDDPAAQSGIFGHSRVSTINQAVGLLLDRGHTPQDARDILQRRADQDGIPVYRAAQGMLDTWSGTAPAGPSSRTAFPSDPPEADPHA
jgi:hypothetical protein